MKHYQKDHIIFFILNCGSWDFKPLLEKAKPTLLDSSLDKPKAPITNVGSQPLGKVDVIFFEYTVSFNAYLDLHILANIYKVKSKAYE